MPENMKKAGALPLAGSRYLSPRVHLGISLHDNAVDCCERDEY